MTFVFTFFIIIRRRAIIECALVIFSPLPSAADDVKIPIPTESKMPGKACDDDDVLSKANKRRGDMEELEVDKRSTMDNWPDKRFVFNSVNIIFMKMHAVLDIFRG